MFILKKIIGRLFFPLSLVIGLLLIGTFMRKGRKKILLTGIVMLYLFSFAPFSYVILRSLESRYVPISASHLNREVRWVVVLGGGSSEDNALTPEDRLGDASMKRLKEGVRLYGLLPKARLILSGGDYRGHSPDALIMQQVALNLGLPRNRMILETSSWDTMDQARFLKNRVGNDPLYLVTSASHMTRAMMIFKRSGTHPIAAPTDFHVAGQSSFQVIDLFPSAGGLANTEMAFYEYLGLVWGFVRGYI